MKLNRTFVRNPGNGYLQSRYSYHCDVRVQCKEGYLQTLDWDIDKQWRPRSDAAERGVWSGSALIA